MHGLDLDIYYHYRVEELISRADATDADLAEMNDWFRRIGHDGVPFASVARARSTFAAVYARLPLSQRPRFGA